MEQEQKNLDDYFPAEIQLIYKPATRPSERLDIGNAGMAYRFLRQFWDDNLIQFIEQVKVLLLDGNNKLLGIYNCSTGGTSKTVVDIRLIYVAALKANAPKILVAHNHPTGALMPSLGDRNMTEMMKQAGRFLEIKLIDHLIVTSEGYFSFAEEGLL